MTLPFTGRNWTLGCTGDEGLWAISALGFTLLPRHLDERLCVRQVHRIRSILSIANHSGKNMFSFVALFARCHIWLKLIMKRFLVKPHSNYVLLFSLIFSFSFLVLRFIIPKSFISDYCLSLVVGFAVANFSYLCSIGVLFSYYFFILFVHFYFHLWFS